MIALSCMPNMYCLHLALVSTNITLRESVPGQWRYRIENGGGGGDTFIYLCSQSLKTISGVGNGGAVSLYKCAPGIWCHPSLGIVLRS